MPNLWSTTTQKLYEAIAGPRTKDAEFDLKQEEFKQMEKSMEDIKMIYKNFYPSTIGKLS
jgi:hypothetical protein